MIFRQLFDADSSSYSYLLASRLGGEALIIDSDLGRVDRYMQLLDELDLRLVKVIDTHVHADHITGMGALRDLTKCVTVMGEQSPADVVSMRVAHGETIDIEGLSLEAIYTPGHTVDSYCFRLPDRVFTGDTLLIRGTGRTDFQGGDPRAAYDSLFNKLLVLPDETLVYPGHDYKGDTVSTIGEERAHNPRLQVSSVDESAGVLGDVLAGKVGPARDVVLLNAAAALVAAGIAPDLAAGVKTAATSIDGGGARAKLDAFVELTQKLD